MQKAALKHIGCQSFTKIKEKKDYKYTRNTTFLWDYNSLKIHVPFKKNCLLGYIIIEIHIFLQHRSNIS